jgi:hypothetical protein
VNRAHEKEEIKLEGGHKISFKKTKSPSDTLWLSKGVKFCSQLKRGLIVAFIVVVTSLIVYLLFIAELQGQIYINFRGSPPGVVCSSLEKQYDPQQIQFLAGLEYLYIERVTIGTLSDLYKRVLRSGTLPCFCADQAE